MYAPACHVHLLPDYIENFDAAVAGGGGKAPSIIVQLHVMHGVSVPSIKTCYGLRHALDCSLPGAGSSGGKLNLAKFLHLEFFCLRASSGPVQFPKQAVERSAETVPVPKFECSRPLVEITQCPEMQGLGKAERVSPAA